MIKESQTKARELIRGASFGPEALHVMFQAFDATWAEIAGNFGDNPLAIEAARLKLANTLLSIANEGSRDAEQLKRKAMQAMALRHRDPSSDPWPPTAA